MQLYRPHFCYLLSRDVVLDFNFDNLYTLVQEYLKIFDRFESIITNGQLDLIQVSGKPIKLVGRGERMDDLEPFYPDRMAGRILGMGDVLSFVEKAKEVVSTIIPII